MDAPKAKKEAEKLKWRPTRPKWKEMKAQKAKMKGNEGRQARKLENWLGHGADKFFVWDLGKTDRFRQLVGGEGPRGRPPQEEMLLNMDHAHGASPCKEQILMCHKKKCH